MLALLMLAVSCKKDEAPLPDNLLQFEAAQQGIGQETSGATVKLTLTRAEPVAIPVTIRLTPGGSLAYGSQFTTTPEAVSNTLTVTVPANSSEVSFTVNKLANALFYGDETLTMQISTAGSPLVIAPTLDTFRLNFAEIISTGTTLVGQGGGATYGNKVFFDLSANTQTAVGRNTWDLGFYSGEEFRVILNSSSAMMARQISKTDLTTVTAADTAGFGQTVIFNQSAPDPAALAYIDYPSGDLARTAIAAVSATLTENRVYIVNRGTGVGSHAPARGWKKIRVIRNASGGYTLQHADIGSTTFTSVDVAKNTSKFFNYVSFENGLVNVEPDRNKWDLAWTYFSNTTNFGSEVPYLFQDIVLQNRNVSVARVMTAARSFTAFGESDIAAQTFSTTQIAIGADWRAGGGPTSAPAVRTDRFYVILDGDGNYYKLRFTALTQNGERGFPAIEYALVRKG